MGTVVYHDDWDMSKKGEKDTQRHHKKIDDVIRKNIRGVISEENIITGNNKKKIKIPVRGLKDFRFKHGSNKNGAGVGQGPAKPGDVIGRKSKDGQSPGSQQAGNEKGEDYLEAEVDIDYILKIVFEDLGLPWIDEKNKQKILVPKGWKFETISKKGILPRLHKNKTMIEAIKRNALFMAEIMEETKCTEEVANSAMLQSYGDIERAIELIKNDEVTVQADGNVVINDEDLRFKQIEHEVEYVSQAVVIAMMDVSASMHMKKKYLARSMLFWMTQFLKKMYSNVDIRFIVHTTEARLVDEETFFHTGESGGTQCSSAFKLANELIDTEYPTSEWNVYCVYMSDGEDFEPAETVKTIAEMLEKNISMLGYIEILVDMFDESLHYGSGAWRTLLKEIKNKYKFERIEKHGTEFYKNLEKRFLLAVIKNKNHVYPALKHLLFKRK